MRRYLSALVIAAMACTGACSSDEVAKDLGAKDQGVDSSQVDLAASPDGVMDQAGADQGVDLPMGDAAPAEDLIAVDAGPPMTLTSTAFVEGQEIPTLYGCAGDSLSPPLAWSNAPTGTESFALIMDDPDAPSKTFVHWVIFDIPKTASGLAEDVINVGVSGMTDFGATGYGGPCPPSGTHRYFFKLYALSSTLGLANSTTKAQLLQAMQGKILGQAQLMGTYGAR